jgi:hypothetical protein
MQAETKRTSLVAIMPHIGLLRLLGRTRNEGLGRETLGRLRGEAVDLAGDDVLA